MGEQSGFSAGKPLIQTIWSSLLEQTDNGNQNGTYIYCYKKYHIEPEYMWKIEAAGLILYGGIFLYMWWDVKYNLMEKGSVVNAF